MSQENVELVRRRFEAFNRGDLEAMVELTRSRRRLVGSTGRSVGGAPHVAATPACSTSRSTRRR